MTTYPTLPEASPAASAYRRPQPARHAPPYEPALPPNPGWGTPPPYDAVAVSIRDQAINRMLRMNTRHAMHAWDNRRQRPVAPHALAFLYADPAFPQRYKVVAATRMVNATPDVRDLQRLLHRLTVLARERYVPAPGGFDPVVHMSNHHDPSSGNATYIGLGISTLDTAEATWEEVQASVGGQMDVPGRCYLLLRDGTAALIDRGGADVFCKVSIRCTRSLNEENGLATRPWTPHDTTESMPATSPDLWARIRDLHALIETHSRRTL